MTTIDTIEDQNHLKSVLRLNQALEDEIVRLKQENMQLRHRVHALETVQVVVFGSSNKLGVALVASSDKEGAAELLSADMAFNLHSQELRKKGVGYAILEKIRVNELTALPFHSPQNT